MTANRELHPWGLFMPDPPLTVSLHFYYSVMLSLVLFKSGLALCCLAWSANSFFSDYTKPETTVTAIQGAPPLWDHLHVARTIDEFTWYCLGPAHHGYQLSLPQLVEAGEQGLWAVWLGMVMPGIDHSRLNGLQDTEQGEAGAQGRGDV